MNIYLAGPLFTAAERSWNAELASSLATRGHRVFLPQAEALGVAAEIFRIDVGGVESSDAVVAILDGSDADSGTAWECGFAYGLNKPIIGLRTDFRTGADDEEKGVNLMLSQSANRMLYFSALEATSVAVLSAAVDEALRDLP